MKKNLIKSLLVTSVVLGSTFALGACGSLSPEELQAQQEQKAKTATTLNEANLTELTGSVISKVLNTNAVFGSLQRGSKHKVSISKIEIRSKNINMNKKDIRRIVESKLLDSNEFEVYDILDRENTHNLEVTLEDTLQNKENMRIATYKLKIRFLGVADNSHHTFQSRKTYKFKKAEIINN